MIITDDIWRVKQNDIDWIVEVLGEIYLTQILNF